MLHVNLKCVLGNAEEVSNAKDVMLSFTGASSAAHIAAQAVARAQAQVSKRAKWDSK